MIHLFVKEAALQDTRWKFARAADYAVEVLLAVGVPCGFEYVESLSRLLFWPGTPRKYPAAMKHTTYDAARARR